MTQDDIEQLQEDARGDDREAVYARNRLRSLFEETVDMVSAYDRFAKDC